MNLILHTADQIQERFCWLVHSRPNQTIFLQKPCDDQVYKAVSALISCHCRPQLPVILGRYSRIGTSLYAWFLPSVTPDGRAEPVSGTAPLYRDGPGVTTRVPTQVTATKNALHPDNTPAPPPPALISITPNSPARVTALARVSPAANAG